MKNRQITRLPAVPLVTCDPYFSLWSPADHLYDKNTCHWTGRPKPIRGYIRIDGNEYRLIGSDGPSQTVRQTGLDVTPTASKYWFESCGTEIALTFCTPLLLDDLDIMSSPCSYIDVSIVSVDNCEHDVELRLEFDEAICCNSGRPLMAGGELKLPGMDMVWMGKRAQAPLSHSGDDVTIDWGYLYLAVPSDENTTLSLGHGTMGTTSLISHMAFRATKEPSKRYLVVAYDDIASIFYFGRFQPGWWARSGKDIITAVKEAVDDHDRLLIKCQEFDDSLTEEALKFGPSYALICAAAYRQTIAAHKLIADEQGNPVFLSKECFSNGCIGTVDVSYPSIPLFLRFNPRLVEAMMRPVIRFAKLPVWPYDFAPHDVGRYPYVIGQVYGLRGNAEPIRNLHMANGDVYPKLYIMPSGVELYDLHYQMPVEECGNMLVMAASLLTFGGNTYTGFIKEAMVLFEKWVQYLLKNGSDPGNQLCTDDFAGHLSHNVNLAIKAVLGIESFAILLKALGREQEAGEYHNKAADMANDILLRAGSEQRTRLTFDRPDSWSLKYNSVWDIIFASGLFPDSFYKDELNWYKTHCNRYGVPLDNRRDYTKSDWIMWCAAMNERPEDVEVFAEPLARFLQESPDRVPFSDWFDTNTGIHHSFQNRTVQGGLYMPLLRFYRKEMQGKELEK
ncbi:MAG TPA: DUF4965 domain-containing protein [Clostridiales bacterium]|nr:DUF4965 domain-containing protein [Clostridiales bacterium]